MAPKTLCDATCEIMVAQQSTRLSTVKYAALQQQGVCPSTTEDLYTKLAMKLSDIQHDQSKSLPHIHKDY